MRSRGQASIESLVMVVFALLMLIIVSLLALQKSSEANDLKFKSDARRVLNIFASNINNIARQGSGFYRYFTLPATLYSNREYVINVYGNLAELSSEDYADTKELITSNVTIICMDKDLQKRNKVYSQQERMIIICNKPQLLIINSSFRPNNAPANDTINVSFTVMNFGPAASGQFAVRINGTTQVVVPRLDSEEKKIISALIGTPVNTGQYNIPIIVDPDDSINESIESDNFLNATINVI